MSTVTWNTACFDYRIQGIPCQIQVVSYKPPINTGEIYDPGEIVYNVLDETGYKAPWLEEKMTQQDKFNLIDQITAIMEDTESL